LSQLIIVCGFPCSGKTSLASAISEKLNITCIHKDAIKERLYELLEMTTLEDSKKAGILSINLMLNLTEDILSNNTDLIIEAPFTFPSDHILFERFITNYNTAVFSIICSAPKDEMLRRFKARPRHNAHHDTERNFEEILSGYDEAVYKTMPGKQIKVISDKPVNELADRVINEIEMLKRGK
jgi:adenylate kinase family enzyme